MATLTRFVQPGKIEIDANERAVIKKFKAAFSFAPPSILSLTIYLALSLNKAYHKNVKISTICTKERPKKMSLLRVYFILFYEHLPIAAEFNIDMSFSTAQITEMLGNYEADHKIGMKTDEIAQEIYDYTNGYPYLVSRLCQLMDGQVTDGVYKGTWTHRHLLEAVRDLVKESNSLFEDMAKKVKDYPELKTLIYDILFCGRSIPYNLSTELVSIGNMFGFLKDEAGQVAISNRIFEIWFYNLFIAEEAISSDTYQVGQKNKNQFIDENGLNMELVLKKFVQHFTESFAGSTDKFIEDNGRKLFLLYIRPLLNDSGNYYIESRTRSMGRTDLIIDFHGKQYIIEMKIWHGEEYNSRGEEQLPDYLKDYNLKKGYMLSFNLNRKKEVGVKKIHFKDVTIVEAVV